jgi:hypothetical protein
VVSADTLGALTEAVSVVELGVVFVVLSIRPPVPLSRCAALVRQAQGQEKRAV